MADTTMHDSHCGVPAEPDPLHPHLHFGQSALYFYSHGLKPFSLDEFYDAIMNYDYFSRRFSASAVDNDFTCRMRRVIDRLVLPDMVR